jgi:hypothetical protein
VWPGPAGAAMLASMPSAVASSATDPAAGAQPPSPPARRRRYGALLITTLCLLFVQGVAPEGGVWQVVITGLAGASLLLAFRAADVAPRLIAAAGGVTAIALAVAVVQAAGGGVGQGELRLVNAALVALGPPAIALGVVRDLRTSRQVRLESLAGVLSLYVLLGMLFAFVFGAIDHLGDEAFFAGGEPATVANCLYFSLTTLTTVGYGDLTAAPDLGRTLAVFEALLGQIYLVTVVSLIVSNIRRPALAERPATPWRTP